MDNHDRGFIFGLLVGLVIAFISTVAAYSVGKEKILQEAHERGYAVQCPGKVGHHWECD